MTLRSKGFTLVELLVTVSLVAILAAIAVPSFSGLMQRSKADAEVSNLQRALNFARLEAINRGVNVRVLPTTGSAWNTELKVVLASDVNTPLRVVTAMSNGATITAVAPGATVTAIEFNNLGGLATPAAAVVMTYTLGSNVWTVTVGLNGRIVSSRT